MKTNAARLLDAQGIAYQVRTYEVDEGDLSAPAVARKVGLPPGQVFKTLLVRGDRHGPCFAVIPADTRLDLKALARLTGDRRIEPVPVKQLPALTGYIRGGVTVLAARKAFPVYVHETMGRLSQVAVSAGLRGGQLVLAGGDYLRITRAIAAAIALPDDAAASSSPAYPGGG